MRSPTSCDRCCGIGWYETDPDGPHGGAEIFCEAKCEAAERARIYDDTGEVDDETRRVWAELRAGRLP